MDDFSDMPKKKKKKKEIPMDLVCGFAWGRMEDTDSWLTRTKLLLLKHPEKVVIWTSPISRRRRKRKSYRWIW